MHRAGACGLLELLFSNFQPQICLYDCVFTYQGYRVVSVAQTTVKLLSRPGLRSLVVAANCFTALCVCISQMKTQPPPKEQWWFQTRPKTEQN